MIWWNQFDIIMSRTVANLTLNHFIAKIYACDAHSTRLSKKQKLKIGLWQEKVIKLFIFVLDQFIMNGSSIRWALVHLRIGISRDRAPVRELIRHTIYLCICWLQDYSSVYELPIFLQIIIMGISFTTNTCYVLVIGNNHSLR